MILSSKRITKALISLRGCPGWSAPLLFANPRRQVLSHQGPYGLKIILAYSHVNDVIILPCGLRSFYHEVCLISLKALRNFILKHYPPYYLCHLLLFSSILHEKYYFTNAFQSVFFFHLLQCTILLLFISCVYPITLRVAKTQLSFGHFECNSVKKNINTFTWVHIYLDFFDVTWVFQ